MMGENAKRRRWKLSFRRSSSSSSKQQHQPPKEFLCPVTGKLMHDPVVVVPTGQTFDRISTQVCKDYNFAWTLEDNNSKVDDFNVVIPNLTLKSTIQNWCRNHTVSTLHSSPPDYSSVENIVKERIKSLCIVDNSVLRDSETEIGVGRFYGGCSGSLSGSSSSSDKSVVVVASPPATPLPFTTKPCCYSSEIEIVEGREEEEEEEEILRRLGSGEVYEQEEGVVLLRKVTRVKEELRVPLCSLRVLLGLRELMSSRYTVVQTNAVAALVNLSLEKCNKLKIVRAGVVPVVIDVLKCGGVEAQEHAAGALFSLALEDENKMAIGVLGALPPLMYALRSESERTRNDSVLALYHLSLVKSNQVKLVRLGAVNTLLGMVRLGFGGFVSRVLLVLCNLAICEEGRSVMLDANAVECFVGMLRKGEFDTEATRENCVAVLYALSHGSLRFKGLAKAARAFEVLEEIEERGTDRAREKARRILQMMKGRDEGEDGHDVDWEGILESGEFSRTRSRVGGAMNVNGTDSNNF